MIAPTEPRPTKYIGLLPALIAIVLYAATVTGDLVCDDLLIVKSLLPGGRGEGVDWQVVFEHFAGAWYGVTEVGYYRPLLTLSFALDAQIGGGSTAVLHGTNVLLHGLACFLCARLCAAASPRQPRLAALIGGLLLAVHPVATESVACLSCRNTTLEMVFRLASMVAFVHYLRRPGGGHLVRVAGWAALALLCKESAMLLPVAFVVLELLLGSGRPWRQRLRPHLLLGLVWIGYLLLRLVVFGRLGSPVSAAAMDHVLAFDLTSLWGKLGQVFLPTIDGAVAPMTVTMAVSTLATLAVAVRRPAGLAVVALGGAWLVVQHLPTAFLGIGPGMVNSRYSYGLVVTVALLASLLWSDPEFAGSRRRRAMAGLFGVLLACLAWGSVQWTGRYFATWDAARHMQAAVDEHGPAATIARPLAFLSLGQQDTVPPVLVRQQIMAFTERPRAPLDYPMVNLTSVLEVGRRYRTIDTLFQDASPVRSVWQVGSAILIRQPDGSFRGPRRGTGEPDLALRRDPGGTDPVFRFTHPVSPFHVEGLRLRGVRTGTPGGTTTCRLRWLDAGGSRVGARSVTLPDRPGPYTVEVDLVRDPLLIGLSLLREANLAGVAVEWPPGSGWRLDGVEAVGRVPELPLPRRFDGATLGLGDRGAGLTAPRLARPGRTMRIVVLAPDNLLAQTIAPGAPVRFTDEMVRALQLTLPLYNQGAYYYYFEELAEPADDRFSRRSQLDYFRLRAPRGSR